MIALLRRQLYFCVVFSFFFFFFFLFVLVSASVFVGSTCFQCCYFGKCLTSGQCYIKIKLPKCF